VIAPENITARALLRTFLSCLAIVLGLVVYVLWGSGITRSIEHRFAGECRILPGFHGPEDIVLDITNQSGWIASIEGPEAGLHYLSYANGVDAQILRAELAGVEPFRPLGLSLWTDASGEKRLFVINRDRSAVEIFVVETAPRLRHLHTVTHNLIRHPNDLTATGPDSFYITNTHASAPDTFDRSVEVFLRLERGDVVHVDGSAARVVATGIGYANGNALSPDGTTFYVSSVATSEIHRFTRSADNSLERRDVIALPGGPDNISMRPDGTFTVALHPKTLAAYMYLNGTADTAPSRVVHVDPRDTPQVQVIYDDPGIEISAASVAPMDDDRMFIGAVAGAKLLDCTLREQAVVGGDWFSTPDIPLPAGTPG
jgi:hypothetical protein